MTELWVYEGSKRREAEETTCLACKRIFLRRKRSSKKKQLFCSKECRFSQTTRVNVACSQCGQAFQKRASRLYGINFCSKKCRDAYRTKPLKICRNCGVQIDWNRSFCSHRCQWDFNYKEYIRRWLKGKENGMNGPDGLSRYINRYLREQRGNKCEKCGWKEINPITGKIPLTVNHVDGCHTNNHISNLELLCPNCHSLTPNYGILNLGNGRKHRRDKIRGLSSDARALGLHPRGRGLKSPRLHHRV